MAILSTVVACLYLCLCGLPCLIRFEASVHRVSDTRMMLHLGLAVRDVMEMVG